MLNKLNFIILYILVGVLIVLTGMIYININKVKQENLDDIYAYANTLRSKELYAQAIKEYQKYLSHSGLDKEKKANIYFILGNMYKDEIFDYQNAYASYLKVKQLTSKRNLIDEVNRNIVYCLDKLGRGREAANMLDNSTSLDKKKNKNDIPVAKVGEKIIYMSEIDSYIDSLPKEVQQQINKQNKKDIITSYLFKILLVRKAKRLGYDRNIDFLRKIENIRNEMLANYLLKKDYLSKLNITDEDIKVYYEQNKQKYLKDEKGNKLSLQEAYERVKQDLINMRIKIKQQTLFNDLLQEESVKIFYK